MRQRYEADRPTQDLARATGAGDFNERLASVERDNRRLKRAGAAATSFVAAALLMGQAPAVTVPDTIAARSFRLVDAAGRVRGVWEAGKEGDFSLVVYDAGGKEGSRLRLSVEEPRLVLGEADGDERAGKRLFSWEGVQRDREDAENGAGRRDRGDDDRAGDAGDEDEPFSWTD